MVELDSVISYCHKRLSIDSITDFENAQNGLQLENNGTVTKIAASVDAGLIPLQQAAHARNTPPLVAHGADGGEAGWRSWNWLEAGWWAGGMAAGMAAWWHGM